MVFSFFKKQPEKMPVQQVARPKPAASPAPAFASDETAGAAASGPAAATELPDLEFTNSSILSSRPLTASQPGGMDDSGGGSPDDPDFTISDFERGFTDSSVMAIDVDHDIDPVQADVEQVAVLFANGQDAVARSLLDTFIHAYQGQEALRFWKMYFDFLQVAGDRAGFEKLCVEFVQTCEVSPPTWRETKQAAPKTVAGAVNLVLQGVLTAEDVAQLEPLRAAVAERKGVHVDCARLVGCDDTISGQLAEMLSSARRSRVDVSMDGAPALLARLAGRLQVGKQEHRPAWELLLELLQRFGVQEQFEEKAVDFAVTFEVSPPSWEAVGHVAKEKAVVSLPPADDAYYLTGDMRNSKFDDLLPVFELVDHPVLDFSGVRRMDFFSAGQLVNRLAPYTASGREIIIRSPNHLVAELMAVVGLNKFARIIVPKS
jgi:anti-anti-sigma regulatory factor